jgi:hypothetical protein
MSTFAMMKWAADLREIGPIDKLVALYFASSAGAAGESSGAMEIVAQHAAEWCCCKKEDAVIALFGLRRHGLKVQEVEPWLFHVFLRLDSNDIMPSRPVPAIEARRFIYVISTPNGVKIGIANNPERRFKSLRSSSPEKMDVHFTGEGPARIIEWAEVRCHRDLVPHHIRGEWFSCSPEIAVAVVKSVLEEGGIILA